MTHTPTTAEVRADIADALAGRLEEQLDGLTTAAALDIAQRIASRLAGTIAGYELDLARTEEPTYRTHGAPRRIITD